ncbi:hypothetical protein AHiyo6_17660 [Arthrobacter sp. Hiyo6]|nr:hypothetical protein AHiyo6_17660 [Arthrobacter sp. Hiyo6]
MTSRQSFGIWAAPLSIPSRTGLPHRAKSPACMGRMEHPRRPLDRVTGYARHSIHPPETWRSTLHRRDHQRTPRASGGQARKRHTRASRCRKNPRRTHCCPHSRVSGSWPWGVLADNDQLLLDEFNPHAFAPLDGSAKSSRLRASRSMLCTTTVSPSRVNRSNSASWGLAVSLPEALSVKTRSRIWPSSWRFSFRS